MNLLKPFHPFLRAAYRYWSRKPRRVVVDGLDLIVETGVFHPTIFYSTGVLSRSLARIPLTGRTFLDLGTGTGRIALTAARAGAVVTASDINPSAIANATRNAEHNGLSIRCVLSDQFAVLPDHFDVIAINPPYYAQEPMDPAASAFFSGKEHGYFERLFPELKKRVTNGSSVLMVLSGDQASAGIKAKAQANGLVLLLKYSERHMGERQDVHSVELSP
jgi:release factor glutamine methyltransferase